MQSDYRRVLIAVNKPHEGEMKSLFERDALSQWQALYADSFSQARFTLQHNPCDALVVHEELLEAEGNPGLAWLAWKRDYPTLLIGQNAVNFRRAYELGVQHCMPYEMILSHPPLLATGLNQSLKNSDAAKRGQRAKEQLTQTRKHLDRLVSMMWRTAPSQDECQWYSEPFIMERLHEELARAERHKVPLSLAVGELTNDDGLEPVLPEWTPEALIRTKRRCDVVGQYGPRGFILLMVHTPKSGALTCCKRLQTYLEHSAEQLAGPRGSIRAFFGMSTTLGDHSSPHALLRAAEQNLDAARKERDLRIVAS